MQLIDPTASDPSQDNRRAPRISDLDGKMIGLLSNSKVNADVLIRETAELFKSHHRCEVLPVKYKTNASAPAPSEIIEELSASCDFLITASGD